MSAAKDLSKGSRRARPKASSRRAAPDCKAPDRKAPSCVARSAARRERATPSRALASAAFLRARPSRRAGSSAWRRPRARAAWAASASRAERSTGGERGRSKSAAGTSVERRPTEKLTRCRRPVAASTTSACSSSIDPDPAPPDTAAPTLPVSSPSPAKGDPPAMAAMAAACWSGGRTTARTRQRMPGWSLLLWLAAPWAATWETRRSVTSSRDAGRRVVVVAWSKATVAVPSECTQVTSPRISRSPPPPPPKALLSPGVPSADLGLSRRWATLFAVLSPPRPKSTKSPVTRSRSSWSGAARALVACRAARQAPTPWKAEEHR
mmetsp:Transcript_9323/g.21079  ORF Transcript_9323/g.21079 Transcript_9323/m.21079 type:complete len:323 (-) Transcript_9323:940-1908(-)